MICAAEKAEYDFGDQRPTWRYRLFVQEMLATHSIAIARPSKT
jgi:hypothetical protein